MHYMHPKRTRGDVEDGIEGIEGNITGVNDDSKDSVALKGNTFETQFCRQQKIFFIIIIFF